MPMPAPRAFPRFAHGATLLLVPVLALLLVLAGCKQAQAPQMPPMPVKVMKVAPTDLPLYRDYPGQVSGSEEAQLRARVGGVLVAQHFEDGQWVRRGQKLFSIDPREALAQQAAADAQLAQAQANLARAQQDVARYGPLVKENAISRQVYDTAVAAQSASAAQVRAAQALSKEAGLGVEYATVVSPFDGRIGAADISVGDLVTAGQTVLATISQNDPAWVYFSPSESDLLEYRKQRAAQGADIDVTPQPVRLILADGSEYPLPGAINFADRALDPGTGTYRLRAEFPNPDNVLTPGMFARVRVQAERRPKAIAVPERAVVQMLGRYFVIVVDKDNKAEQRPVTPGPRQGALWVIDSGLAPGERIVVEGVQKAQPGALLAPTEVTLQQLDAGDAGDGAQAPTPAEG